MNYAVEIGLGAMIYIPSFIETSWDIQKLIGRVRSTDTNRKVIS
jgi:hypothetical protein